MTFSTVQLGRLALKELPQNPASEQLSAITLASSGRLLHVVGQEAYPLSTVAQMAALHDDLQGLVAAGTLIPVTFGDKADRNGFYTVYSAQDVLQNWNGEAITDDWTVDLQRVGSPLEIDFESRLTGPNAVNNSFALGTAVNWNSPPANAYAFYSGNIASTLARACSDGPAQTLYFITAGNPATTVRWGCAVADYGNGRARFLDSSGLERSGINFSVSNVASWTLTNGLVRVQPGTSGNTLDVACWSNGAWQTRAWDLSYTSGNMSGWQSANLLRNDYEMVILRLVKDGFGFRVQIDLTLRRGSRFVELYINVGAPSTITVVRHTAETGVAATGTVTAKDEDSAGNKYAIGSAHTFTSDTVNGGLSVAGTVTLDCYIGAVVSQAVLNANPYFETDVSNWTPTSCTFARSVTRAHQGSASALMTPNGVATQVFAECEKEPVTAGQPYTASGWIWPTNTITANCSVSINWYNVSNTLISTSTFTTSATGGTWTFLTGNATAPAGAVSAAIDPVVGGTPAVSQLVWWDELKLRPALPGGESASDLLNQYVGRRGEYVQAVRR